MNSKEALNKLIEGNKRFVESNHVFPNLVKERRIELINGQDPFAVIISCSDSRVPSEIVFDRGLGDLFVIRNAGNIVSSSVIGSVEYALSHLNVKLVVILGHDDCGAVKATINNFNKPSFIKNIIENIRPAIDKTENNLYKSIINNVKLQGNKLKTAGNIIPNILEKQEAEIMGGYYCLKTGKINFFEI